MFGAPVPLLPFVFEGSDGGGLLACGGGELGAVCGLSTSTFILSWSDMALKAENLRSWSGGRFNGCVVLGSKGCRGELFDFGKVRLFRGDPCSAFRL